LSRGLLLAVGALACAASVAAPIAPEDRRSGYDFMSRQTQAMQDDELTGPAVFALAEGERLWNEKAGNAGRSCADCHGDPREVMRGVAARYPAFNARLGKPITLEQRILRCRTERQDAAAFAPESRELLALTAVVGRASRGMPIVPDADPRSEAHREAGARIFKRRMGQLNLSCAQCHDDNWGKSLAGSRIPQGHATGYPIYRLEWQGMGSLTRRLRSCMTGVRALPFTWGSAELVDLEMYLMSRARAMKVETPAVRP
jgi:L-cysteine S-thiosulfotransferase